jgi:hypothetical protein
VSAGNWHRDQRVIKLRYGTIQKWKQLATLLGLDENRTVRVLLDLTADFVINRRIWLSGQELSKRLAPGAAAHMAALGLAENRNGQVVLLDVERTVNESLMRRDNGLKQLPAVRARDLAGKMYRLYEEARCRDYIASADDQRVLELLRARASDKVILERWQRAVLSNGFPPVKTFADLNRTWASWEAR